MTTVPKVQELRPALEQIAGDAPAADPAAPDTYRLLDANQVRELKAAPSLIHPVLPSGLVVLFGGPGTGKTFMALDWCLCIAAGIPWFGRPVATGVVVYLAGEGVGGLGKRIDAWEAERGTPVPADRFMTVPEAANLLDPDQLAKANRTLSQLDDVRLIVVDTLSRHAPGGDENSAKDMTRFIHGVEHLRAIHGSGALVIHHTGKDTARDERGSSSLEGAADARIRLDGTTEGLTITCKKMKDDEPFDPWHLRLDKAHGSRVVRLGKATGSLTAKERQILGAVSTLNGTAQAVIDDTAISKSTVYRTLRTLEARGLIAPNGTGTHRTYNTTRAGTDVLFPNSPTPSHGTQNPSPVPPPSLKGGTGTTGPRNPAGDATGTSRSPEPDSHREREVAS
jgi:hypothetical protein